MIILQVPRLIRFFPGCTSNFVGFAVFRLIYGSVPFRLKSLCLKPFREMAFSSKTISSKTISVKWSKGHYSEFKMSVYAYSSGREKTLNCIYNSMLD